MRIKSLIVLLGWIILVSAPSLAQTERQSKSVHWPMFRGVQASGVAKNYPTPTEWNTDDSTTIKWKTAIPGLGHSSPVIWGDRIFITTAISGKKNPYLKVGLYGNIDPVNDDTEHEWKVYCLNKNSGKILWEQTAHQGVPTIKRHTKATHANSTPATDGKHVVAFFGSEGLYCYNTAGKLLWKKDLGVLDSGYFRVPEAQWEFGSSPMIYKDVVVVQCDVQKNSFIAAFDIKTGSEIWRTPRDEVPTWSTPMVHSQNGKTQVIVNGFKHIGGYDFKTGKEIWKLEGGGDIPVPTPIVAHDLVFITNAHGGASPIYAIRLNAAGDISPGFFSASEHIVWSEERGGCYMQTPIVYGEHLYVCRDNGVLSCFKAEDGELVYRERLARGRTGFTASPVAANNKIYFTSEMGDVYVIQAGAEFRILAQNPMNEVCMATPAISEGVLFFRTLNHLVAVAGGQE